MVNIFYEARNILIDSFSNLWDVLVRLIPELIAALIIILVGWVIGKILHRVLRGLLRKVGLDKWVKREGLSPALWGKNFSSVLAAILKWYIFGIFFVQALGLIDNSFTRSLMELLNQYIHKIFGGAVLLVLASLLAEHIKRVIMETNIVHGKTIGNVVKILLVYFIFVLTLQVIGIQAGLLAEIFKIAFTAFAITIAIILGIGFGLAFSEDARKIVNTLKKKK